MGCFTSTTPPASPCPALAPSAHLQGLRDPLRGLSQQSWSPTHLPLHLLLQKLPSINSFIHSSGGHGVSTTLGINAKEPKKRHPTEGQSHTRSSFPEANNAVWAKTAGFLHFCFFSCHLSLVLPGLHLRTPPETSVFGSPKSFSHEQGLHHQ